MIIRAEKELDRLLKQCGDDSEAISMQKIINDNVLETFKLIHGQEHSGFTVQYLKGMLVDLIDGKPLTPLTGDSDEWEDVSNFWGEGRSVQQNNRCSAVFRENNDNSTAYYMNGKSFSENGGKSYYTNKESRVPLVFPCYIPKTEYIILNQEEKE